MTLENFRARIGKVIEKPRSVRIKKIVDENPNVKTFFLDAEVGAVPGQFLMVWLPGVDEKPLSISYTKPLGITVRRVGKFTEKLFELKVGDFLGIRGPYGNGFSTGKKNSVVVGGGIGIPPIAILAEKINPISIIGARTKDDLLFAKRLEKCSKQVIVMTDDGSAGKKGFVTAPLEEVLSSKKIGRVYACGPEKMLVKCLEIANRHAVPIELSLERYMKCGIGICGNCVLGESRICRDGPVYTAEQLKGTEFGRSKLDRSGASVPI